MQLRCPYCQTMFALTRETVEAAYAQMVKEGLHHYDAHCPRCRRAVFVTREQFERFNPALKNQPPEAAKAAGAAKTAKPPAEKRSAPKAAKKKPQPKKKAGAKKS
jgi:hypothetical protein